MEEFIGLAGLDHEGFALLVQAEDLAVVGPRRGGKVARADGVDTGFVSLFSGLQIEAGEDPLIVENVKTTLIGDGVGMFGAERVRLEEGGGPAGAAGGLGILTVAVRAPEFLAGLLVIGGEELLFFVVTEDDEDFSMENGGATGAKFVEHGEGRLLRVPAEFSVSIVGPDAEVFVVDVDEFAVGDWGFRGKAVLAMMAFGRAAGVELLLPLDGAGLEVEAVQEVMEHDLVRQFI